MTPTPEGRFTPEFVETLPERMAQAQVYDAVTLTMKDGSLVTMRRSDDGGVEICHVDSCLTLPASAPEFLALLEFMETFQAEP